VAWAVLVAAGYLAGSLPFGYWLIRVCEHEDIRTVGSGNIGASNVWRAYGRRYGLTVALLDVLKGFAPALAGTLLVSHRAGVVAGTAAMLGHWRPLFLKLAKGGKMVATCAGAFLGVAPLVALAGLGAWLLVFAVTRYASVASMVATVAVVPFAIATGEPRAVEVFAAVAAVAVVVLHRANIRRLLQGTESRFRFARAEGRT
jgi:glycerol-3-phosphate acyltransferase PlsY